MSNVKHPKHYQQHIVEDIEIIEDVIKDYPKNIHFHVGTALKYILRAPFKGKLKEDLEKAVNYLEMAIAKLNADKPKAPIDLNTMPQWQKDLLYPRRSNPIEVIMQRFIRKP